MNAPQKSTWDLFGPIITVWVVIMVVGGVVAVLFPIFMRSRERPVGHTCQSNLKECAIALQTYWNDYDGHLPSSALVHHSRSWHKRGFETYAMGGGALPARGRARTWAQLLYSGRRGKSVFYCPKESPYGDTPGVPVSYWWKAAIDKAWYGVGCKKPCRAESDFTYNADQVVLYERAGFHFDASEGLTNGVRINVAYLDTHVRSVTITNSSDTWITSPTAPGEPAYFNFDNKKPRSASNPPPEQVRPTYTDPSRYSDMLP